MLLFQDCILHISATTIVVIAVILFYVFVTFRSFLNTLRSFMNHSSSSAKIKEDNDEYKINADSSSVNDDLSVLPCIRNRRSIFPNSYLKDPPTSIDRSIIQSLLDAALWSPFHSNCYKDSEHPAQFVILGKKAMVQMQQLTLDYYDRNWEQVGWGSESCSLSSSSSCNNEIGTKDEYLKWRQMTADEITGRWSPVEYMIAIVMRRQSTPHKRLPEWEEIAAVATAVQNMHIQACAIQSKQVSLACYWSSWHSAVCNSTEMKDYLNLNNDEDRCMGFFMIAQQDPFRCSEKDRRKRDKSLLKVEWRE